MKTLYVRNVPDEVVERLERLAAAEGISVNAVVLRELSQVSRRADSPGPPPDPGQPVTGQAPAASHGPPCCMVSFMSMKRRLKISKGGQISIPAEIRHRWETSTVALEDLGDRVVLAPAPDDPVAAAEGALAEAFPGLDLARLRRVARGDARRAEARLPRR